MDLYQKYRPVMQSGDCLLWASKGIIGALIRFFSRAKVNHASLVLRMNEWEGLKDRVFLLEALEGGIELRLLSDRLREYHGEVYWIPLRSEYDHLRGGIITWALGKVGTPYDFHSLFKNILGRVSAEATRLFCSEYVFLAWKEAGLPVSGKAPRPGDIPEMDILGRMLKIYG